MVARSWVGAKMPSATCVSLAMDEGRDGDGRLVGWKAVSPLREPKID